MSSEGGVASPRATTEPGALVSALRRSMLREWPLIVIGLAALALRGHQLLDQIPVDDEWHALGQATTHRMRDILTQFGISDVSIPIAAYYKALILTTGLTTWGLRLPFLVFGLATVVGFPIMVRPIVGRPAANVLAALLAVSPRLIFFSRFARPYAIALFCAFGAAMAFRAWWNSGRLRWAVIYVALAASTCWLVLIMAPFVLGSFVLFGAAGIGSPGARRETLRRLARLGFVTLLALAVLLGPPIWFDGRTLLSHANSDPIRWIRLYSSAVFALASARAAIAIGILALAGVGMVVLALRESRFAGHMSGLAALQIVSFVVARPSLGNQEDVSSRYLLPVLAVTLVFAAVGIVAVCDGLGRSVAGRLCPALTTGLCAVVLWWSQVPLIVARPNDWASHYLQCSPDYYNGFYVRNVRKAPPFYETLAAQPPGSTPIVEVSINYFTFLNPLPFYQRIHRQPVLIGMRNGLFGPPVFGETPYGHPGVDLRTNVFVSDIETMRRRGARYVIVHRDLYAETKNPPTWISEPPDMQPCIDWLRTKLGEPVFEGRGIVVFQL
jgi:hypothetical protein